MHNFHLWLLMSERFVYKILIVCVYTWTRRTGGGETIAIATHILGTCCCTQTHTQLELG